MGSNRAVALFVLVALGWGGSYVAIDVGLRALEPLLFAAYRVDTAALVAVPLAFAVCERAVPRTRDEVAGAVASGVLVACCTNALLFTGQQSTTGAVASILFSTNPVLAAAFARLLLPSERLDAVERTGLLVGFVGVALVVRPSFGALAAGTAGKLLVLAGAASLALGSVTVGRIDSDLHPLAETAWGLALGAVCLHAASLAAGEQFVVPESPALLGAIAYTGIAATAVAYPLYFELVGSVGPVRANLVSYAVPVVTAVSGWLVLEQTVGPVTAVGFAVIAVGFGVVNRSAIRSLVTSRASRA